MPSYSYQGVNASIAGAGGVIALANTGSGAADEGISVAMAGDKNVQTLGAAGDAMNSLKMSKAGIITVRLLKTSPRNAVLQKMYILQSESVALWGQNIITIRDSVRGDIVTARECAFKKQPDNVWATVGNTLEWSFDCSKIDMLLGVGTPSIGDFSF